jgi:hypothetical protein
VLFFCEFWKCLPSSTDLVVLAILAFEVLFNFYQFAKFIDHLELHANSNSRLQYINATRVERIKPLH